MSPQNETQEFPRYRNLDVNALSASPSNFGKHKNQNIFMVGSKKEVYEIQHNDKKKKPGKARMIFRIFCYANKKDMAILVLSILAAIGNGLMSPLNLYLFFSPILMMFIERETPGQNNHVNITEEMSKYTNYGFKFYCVSAANIILGFIQIIASEIASRNIMAKIKTAYLKKMLSIEIGWYDKSQEQFVSTVSHDLQKMMVLFDSKITSTIEMLSFFVFGSLAALAVSWKVALLTLALMVFSLANIYFIMQVSKKKARLQQHYRAKCSKITSEVIGNARTVAAYGGEYKEIERFMSTLKMVKKYGIKHATVISIVKAFNYFQLCLCYMIAYYFSVQLYLKDEFSPGNIAVILKAQINAMYHTTYMLNTISDLLMATDSAYRVMEFLDTETSYNESIEQGIIPSSFETKVSFRNAEFSYPTNLHTKVLHDLTLDIEPGKVTAVVGTSGGGKSTILGLIARLYDVTGGQVLIGGVDIRKLNIGWLRNQIGVVVQEPTLFDVSIEENIRFGNTTATLEEIIEAAKVAYAHSFIEKLPSGYDTIVGERGTKLSGGQKQRIAIARAIVRKPKLLLLDEATSALDSRSEGIVQEALDNAMYNRTTVIVAHRMSTVQKADVIYAMKDGRIVEKGSHRELMELHGYYYSLVKIQEREDKDKAATPNSQGGIYKEDLIEEESPVDEECKMEELENKKKLKLSKKNLKVAVVWLLAILFTATTAAFLPAFYYVFSLLCQSFTYPNDEINQVALTDGGILFSLGVITFFSAILSGTMSTLATQIWLKKLQKKAFYKLITMDISWFDKIGNSPNECLEILTNSPQLIESVTGDKAAQVVVFMLSLFLCLVFCFLLSIKVSLAILPLIMTFFIINCLRLKSRKADTKSASLATRSTKVATEYVQNVKTIQLLNCQTYVISKYNEILTLSKKEAFPSIMCYAVVYGVSKALMKITMGTAYIFGAKDIVNGNIRGTTMNGAAGSLSSASTLAGPVMILMSQYPAARQAMAQLYRIAYTKTFLNVLGGHGAKPEINGNIVFEDVMFSYPTRDKVQVLKKLNLKIEAGKTVALVGDSGCGKSTIISLLERFYFPNGGRIIIDGNNINDINVRYLRSQMGLVSQEPVLFDMTIKENIIYGFEEEVTIDRIIDAAKIANIHEFIMKLPQAYDTPVGERGSKLSGGQKQRIAIARAVLRNPKILLLDEATSALDTENEKAVQEALNNASVGKTTIMVAHRLSTIREADKIVFLESGEVVEEGNHEELVKRRGHYFNLLNK